MPIKKPPYMALDKEFNITYYDAIIAENYGGFLNPGFFRTLMSGYSRADFTLPTVVRPPEPAGGINFLMAKSDDGLDCWLVKKDYDILRKDYENAGLKLKEEVSVILSTIPLIGNSISNDDPDKALKNLDDVYRRSYKILRNINNMSLTSKLLAGYVFEKEVFDISNLTEQLSTGITTVEREIRIIPEIEKGLKVEGNRRLISTGILNLVSNSINFKSDEPPRIKINLHRNKSRAVFSYSDNSKGIKDVYLPFISKPYFSKDPYDDGEADPSLGIGLFIAKSAFEQAGGSLFVSSSFGEGVTYTFSLPLREDGEEVLSSFSSDYLLNRYSELFVQLCESCMLPSIG